MLLGAWKVAEGLTRREEFGGLLAQEGDGAGSVEAVVGGRGALCEGGVEGGGAEREEKPTDPLQARPPCGVGPLERAAAV